MAEVPPFLWQDTGTFAVPKTYTVPGAGEVQPYTAHATFDGTGASGTFRPCLTFYSQEGVVLGRYFPVETIAAGASAEVTYTPPFGTAPVSSSGGGGAGFQFNAGAYGADNIGDFTTIETSAPNPDGYGMTLDAKYGVHIVSPDGQLNGALVIDQTAAHGSSGFETLLVNADDGGHASNQVFAIEASASMSGASGAPFGVGINASADSTGNNAATIYGGQFLGFVFSGNAAAWGLSAAALVHTGEAIGADISSETRGTGDAIGAKIQAAHGTGGTGTLIPLQVFVGATKVFEIQGDGSLHGLTGQALTFDL
jgi:hypothetical protein